MDRLDPLKRPGEGRKMRTTVHELLQLLTLDLLIDQEEEVVPQDSVELS